MGPYSWPNKSHCQLHYNCCTRHIMKRRNPDPRTGMKRHAYKNKQKATEVVRPSNDTQLVTKRQTTTSYLVTTLVELYDRNSRKSTFQWNA